jgi:hypothetical protein
VYSRPEGLPSTSAKSKRGRKGKKHSKLEALVDEAVEEAASDSTPEPPSSPTIVQAQVEEYSTTDSEDDAVYESDEEVITPAAVTPAAATPATVEFVNALAAEITVKEAAPVEEEPDDSDDIVFDDDGSVITDSQGQPIALSVWRAKQAQTADKQSRSGKLLLDTSSDASKHLPATCQKAAALNKTTSPAKRSTAAAKKSIAAAKNTIAAAKKTRAPKRPTVSQKKIPSQRSTVSGKKIPSQQPAVSKKQVTAHNKRAPSPVSDDDDDDNDDLEAALQAGLDVDNESESEDGSGSDDDDSQPEMVNMIIPRSIIQPPSAAVTQQETAESAEDKRTLRDLEANFGDFKEIRVKHDFEAFQEALHDAWSAVGCRSGPLKVQWNAMMVRKRETPYDGWEYSEDES